MAFDYIHIDCVVCKGQNKYCLECKGTGKRRVEINYHPISGKLFTDEEYELIITCMKQMFRTFRGEEEQTLPPNFLVNRTNKTE